MSFSLADFQEALDELGVNWRMSGQSMAVQDCPACGSSKYKVIFRSQPDENEEVFFGKCLRGSCGEGYSSVKYLTMAGMSRSDAYARHGKDPVKNFKGLAEIDQITVHKPDLVQPPQHTDISAFIDIDSMPKHYVAKYAYKRGYTPEQSHVIKMDIVDNSVVFLVLQGLEPIGYQKRFVSPYANPKTKTSHGFKRDVCLSFYRPRSPLVVCEGPFTALSAWHYGFHGACTFGSSLTKEQLKWIATQGICNPVYYALETDDEASKDALRKFRAAMAWEGVDFKLIKPEVGKDLNDSWQAQKGYKIEEPDTENVWLPKIDLQF